jgi:S1-C subfamily serine protease
MSEPNAKDEGEPEKPGHAGETIHRPRLVGSDGRELIIIDQLSSIGRSETNDLVLKGDKSASHSHARIELTGGKVIIKDLNSENGTWVNGKRITSPTSLNHGDKIRVGNNVFRLHMGDRPLPPLDPAMPVSRARWIALSVITLLIVGFGLSFIIRQVIHGEELNAGATQQALSADTETQQAAGLSTLQVRAADSATQKAIGLSTQQAAATAREALRPLVVVEVEIHTTLYNLNFIGSGSLLSEDGYILTNFHVLGIASTNPDDGKAFGLKKGDLYNDQELVLVGLNPTQPDAKPNTFYKCEIVAKDPDLDLAVLHVVSLAYADANRDPLGPLSHPHDHTFFLYPWDWSFSSLPPNMNFNHVSIGDSDNLAIGDSIRVLGFPAVGRNTAIVTEGVVSGFLPDQNSNSDKGWIKTEADIKEGNSGGLVINQRGELIGVPTWGSTAAGTVNYVRPINLAFNLIEGACPACLPSRTAATTANAAAPTTPTQTFTSIDTATPLPTIDLTLLVPPVYYYLQTQPPKYATPFSSNLDVWQPNGEAKIENGALVVRSAGKWNAAQADILTSDKFAVQFNLSVRGSVSGGLRGVCSFEANTGTYSEMENKTTKRLQFAFSSEGSPFLNSFSQNQSFTPLVTSNNSYNFVVSAPVIVVVNGNEIGVAIDNQVAFATIDPAGDVSYTGYSLSADQGVTCEFTDLKVWDLREVSP